MKIYEFLNVHKFTVTKSLHNFIYIQIFREISGDTIGFEKKISKSNKNNQVEYKGFKNRYL